MLDAGGFNEPDYQWGHASSPVIHNGVVFVQCDIQKGSFAAAYDVRDGSEVWRTDRDEVPSWATPTIQDAADGPVLITVAPGFARAYDARTGEERWRLARHSAITIPTPFVAHDVIFLTSGYQPIQPIYAIRTDAQGDISLSDAHTTSNDSVVWSTRRGGPYMSTPLVYGDALYVCDSRGILSCYEALTGRRVYRKRVGVAGGGSFTASLVAADGRIFLTSDRGGVVVVKAGSEFEQISTNNLGDFCLATPAIAGGRLIARTRKYVVAIGSRDLPDRCP